MNAISALSNVALMAVDQNYHAKRDLPMVILLMATFVSFSWREPLEAARSEGKSPGVLS
jgi:hypothetical protein